ncbi:ChaN family lipoprotein [Pseudomonadota bacterium]
MIKQMFRWAVLAILMLQGLNACQVKSQHGHSPHAVAGNKSQSHEAEEDEAEVDEPKIKTAGLVLDLRNMPTLDSIISELAKDRVIYVGEAHTTYGHHLSQLEVIRRLHEIDSNIAIGLEFFQQPFQQYLDEYIAGTLDEKEMLRKTEYYLRWVYDFRHYKPILDYAKEHAIPLIALNIPKEITRKVGAEGMDALTDEEKAKIPDDIDESNSLYKKRIKDIFYQHPHGEGRSYEKFMQVQLLWDEGMAERAAEYLKKNPEKRLVVLAGIGHLEDGTGIPQRVNRRVPVESSIVLPADSVEVRPGVGDFLLYPEDAKLPPKGRMGIVLARGEKSIVSGVLPGSAAEKAGMEKGDVILSLNGESTEMLADLRVFLVDKKPGDQLDVVARRKRFFFGETEVRLKIKLDE